MTFGKLTLAAKVAYMILTAGLRDEGWGWRFEVYNIENWATDGGDSLHKQESGCGKAGGFTGWEWHPATSTSYAYAYFNLDFFIKSGCVERAIVSAGGPKISCTGHGLDLSRRHLNLPHELEGMDLSETLYLAEKARAEGDLRARAMEAQLARRAMTTRGPNPGTISSTPNFTYPSTFATASVTYIPQNWTGTNDTIVFTITDTLTPNVTTFTTIETLTENTGTTIYTTTLYSIITTSGSATTSSVSSSALTTNSGKGTSQQTSNTSSSSTTTKTALPTANTSKTSTTQRSSSTTTGKKTSTTSK